MTNGFRFQHTLYPPMDAHTLHTLCDHLAVSPINFNYKLFENCDLVYFFLPFFLFFFYRRHRHRDTSLTQLNEQTGMRARQEIYHFNLSTAHFIMV